MNFFKNIDYISFFSAFFLSAIGLSLIYSFDGNNTLFFKQVISLSIAIIVFFITSKIDIYFLKKSNFIYLLYFIAIGLFVVLMGIGSSFSGAQSWFSFGFFTFQPTDFAKIVLVFVLAKYFFKRHIEISRIKHLVVSGIYAGIMFILLALQPDLGSAMVVFFIWFGFILVTGVPKRYILVLLAFGSILSFVLYSSFFAQYQKERIDTFLNPHLDPLGSGYNISQANIALGSGEWFGKGVLSGTQSRLNFLPEANTDFIYSAYGEEWGFIGILVLFTIFLIIITRIIFTAIKGRTNFEALLAAGIAIYFLTHFFVHIGINIGIMPVTGMTMPFMSYGGSHLLIEYFALGLVNAISKTKKQYNRKELSTINMV